MHTISRDELRKVVDGKGGARLVDALPSAVFAKGHLPGAISIPLESIHDLAPNLLLNKGQQIITYCASIACTASKQAAEELEKLGYTNVSAYEGGKEDWQKAGFPLEGVSRNTPDIDMRDKPDPMEDGKGEANAVSSHTVEDLEQQVRDYDAHPNEPRQDEPPQNVFGDSIEIERGGER